MTDHYCPRCKGDVPGWLCNKKRQGSFIYHAVTKSEKLAEEEQGGGIMAGIKRKLV